MNRSEHLDWCKERALEYLDTNNDYPQAWSSMVSDLGKHDETANHSAIELGMMMLMTGQLNTSEAMRKFINGFN